MDIGLHESTDPMNLNREPMHGFTSPSVAVWATLALMASALCVETLAQGTFTFGDTEFADVNWKTTTVSQAPGVTASNAQQSSGGSPGGFRQFTASFAGAQNFVNLQAHIYSSSYDPVAQGAITSVILSLDAAGFSGQNGAIFDYGPALEQAGSYYGHAGWGLTSTDGKWHQTQSVPMVASFFTLRAGSGPSHPDFSLSGAPIRFGYFTDNSFTFANSGTRVGGIDNWSVTLTLVPEPSSLALLALASLICGFRKSAKIKSGLISGNEAAGK